MFDKKRKFIKNIFSRENCIHTINSYIKELNIFRDRSLENMIIVDNSIFSFCTNINNGIYIQPFKGDKYDSELEILAPFLEELVEEKDVRLKIKSTFKNSYILKKYSAITKQPCSNNLI